MQVKLSVHQSDNRYFLRSSKKSPKSHPYLSHTLKKAYSVKEEKDVSIVISADYPYHFKGKLYFHCDRYFALVRDNRHITNYLYPSNHASVSGLDLSPIKIIFPTQFLSSPAIFEIYGVIQTNSFSNVNETFVLDETLIFNLI
jgi:hypothetical protein